MKFIGDYHMHSKYSDGRATVEEMVCAAQACGLEEVGIADHGPHNIGTGVKESQDFLRVKKELTGLQPQYPELKLLAGAEADVVSLKGGLDVSEAVIKELDYLIVGLHPYVLPVDLGGTDLILGNQAAKIMPKLKRRMINMNTKALAEAIHKNPVWAISHPGLKMAIDIPEVARAAVAKGTMWEINAGHKHPNYQQVLEAARCGVDFVVNSDAHYPESVGYLDYGAWVVEKCQVPVERVRNARITH